MATADCHSWAGPLGHCHQTFLLDAPAILSGVRPPFFVGCHWIATSWNSEANALVTETFLPAQNGHPLPRVSSWTLLRHSWSGPSGHTHQACLSDPKDTPVGARLPFFSGCHWAANSGYRASKELVTETLSPRQNGHPYPIWVRPTNLVSHSWSGPSGHFHQTFR